MIARVPSLLLKRLAVKKHERVAKPAEDVRNPKSGVPPLRLGEQKRAETETPSEKSTGGKPSMVQWGYRRVTNATDSSLGGGGGENRRSQYFRRNSLKKENLKGGV